VLDREGRDWVRARLHCTVYDARYGSPSRCSWGAVATAAFVGIPR
jgi:hypothetical protein